MHLVRLMWRLVSESKLVHSRYSQLSQAWRTAEPIRIISAVSNWFRRQTSHELNSLNSIRLLWSTASEQGFKIFFFAPRLYFRGNLRVHLATPPKSLRKFNLRPLATTCWSVWPELKTFAKSLDCFTILSSLNDPFWNTGICRLSYATF